MKEYNIIISNRFNNILKFNVADDNNKGTGKKVKKVKKRIKELDNKVTKGKSKDTDDKKRKRKKEKTRRQQQVRLRC